MDVVRLIVYLVAGIVLGLLLSSLMSWFLGWACRAEALSRWWGWWRDRSFPL